MNWGEYLCKGVSIQSGTGESSDKCSVLLDQVEKALRSLGLTPFSSSVATQYLSVSWILKLF